MKLKTICRDPGLLEAACTTGVSDDAGGETPQIGKGTFNADLLGVICSCPSFGNH